MHPLFTQTLLAASTLLLVLPTQAQPSYPRRPPPVVHPASCASIEVGSQGRLLLPVYFRQQLWIEGRDQAEYTLSVVNNCPNRVLAVLSVDGLNVLSGNKASVNQAGYIIEPYARITVSGWRKSLDQTAAFFFTYPQNSYAARVGKDGNLGVIGAAFFRERPAPVPQYEERAQAAPSAGSSNAPADASASESRKADKAAKARTAPAAAPSLGTGHGRRIDDAVSVADFERESYPFATVSLRYETRAKLIAMGAIHPQSSQPSPFPADPGFVPDPPR